MEFKRVILQGGWHYGSKWNWEWLFLSGEKSRDSWDEGIGFETIVSDGG